MIRRPPRSTLLPSTTLSRSHRRPAEAVPYGDAGGCCPICHAERAAGIQVPKRIESQRENRGVQSQTQGFRADFRFRSEEHTSELQSHLNLVCRLLLEKKTPR